MTKYFLASFRRRFFQRNPFFFLALIVLSMHAYHVIALWFNQPKHRVVTLVLNDG